MELTKTAKVLMKDNHIQYDPSFTFDYLGSPFNLGFIVLGQYEIEFSCVDTYHVNVEFQHIDSLNNVYIVCNQLQFENTQEGFDKIAQWIDCVRTEIIENLLGEKHE